MLYWPRVEKFTAAVAELTRENAELAQQNAELTRQNMELSRKLNENSSNSNKPPSSDGLGRGRSNRKKKKPTGRKRGGQPGHKGHYRRLIAAEDVDKVVDVFLRAMRNLPGCSAADNTAPAKRSPSGRLV